MISGSRLYYAINTSSAKVLNAPEFASPVFAPEEFFHRL
jgi:hypothetical protein